MEPWKSPGKQGVQLPAVPAEGAAVPSAHGVHESAPAKELVPAGQVAQLLADVWPAAELIATVPAGHKVQDALPATAE